MPLRLVNKNRTHAVVACDTNINIISMSIGEKSELLDGLLNLGDPKNAFDRLLSLLGDAIVSIDGFEGQKPVEVLRKLEDFEQLRAVMKAIIAHCSLNLTEAKNSPSSSEQPTPESAGNVDNDASPDKEPASTT
jgi:hypothetical protein